MKFVQNLLKKEILVAFILMFFTTNVSKISAQNDELENAIREHRMGQIKIKAKPGSEVKVEQISHEFWFGCAISNNIFDGSASESDRKQYKEKFLKNFNSAVTENAVKWGNMERRKGEVNYEVVDGILAWTDENDIPLRGHNLFWGTPRFVQPWLKELSDVELEQTIKNRAEAITSRYRGRFSEYDLNNEMIHGNYYEDRLGPGITKKMAEWAQGGDPEVNLYLNDFDILTGNKLVDYLAHIRLLLKQGVPIAGIGVQGHLHGETFDRSALKNALDSLARFNLPVKITEFNMPGQRSTYMRDRNIEMNAEEEQQKAYELVDYYKICFAHPAVDGILMWGFWAGANWIPVSSLYKRDWTPTPAAKAYQDLIFNEWWTTKTGKIGSDGEYELPAFYGNYRITVDGKTKEVDLSCKNRHLLVEF